MLERVGGARLLARAPAVFGALLTTAWVWTGWVFFRADDLPHALRVLAVLAGGGAEGAPVAGAASWISPHLVLTFAIAWVCACAPDAWVRRATSVLERRVIVDEAVRALLLIAGFVLCLMALAALSHNPFIYYRF